VCVVLSTFLVMTKLVPKHLMSAVEGERLRIKRGVLPIARDELIASPSPIYLSSIIRRMPPAQQSTTTWSRRLLVYNPCDKVGGEGWSWPRLKRGTCGTNGSALERFFFLVGYFHLDQLCVLMQCRIVSACQGSKVSAGLQTNSWW
jgi:hypothetical protein